jgi:sugar phosphate isomerase/epimerase
MKKLLFVTALLATAATPPPPKTFRDVAGVELYSFRETLKTDVDKGLKMAKDLGLKEVECFNFGPKFTSAADLRQRMDAHGLKATGWAADFATLQNPDKLKQAIADAKTLGAPYVVTFWIDHKGKDFTKEDADKAIAVFNQAGKEIKAAGLQFAYHAHGYEFQPYQNGTLFDYLYQNTDKNAVMFELDTFWAYWGGQDPVQFLKKYGSRTPLLHLKDCVKGVTGNKTGAAPVEYDVPLGTGQVPIAAVLREAKKQGVKHYLIEDESANVPRSIGQSLAFLESVKY